MSTMTRAAATLDNLFAIEGKAELIGGRIVPIMPTGRRPNLVAGRIYRDLAAYVDEMGRGEVYTDNMGFAVTELSSGRQSFSPDVSYYAGPFSANTMRFAEGPPTFAVEVRSESDYGPAAEAALAAKRADYFEAGTLVVWDADPLAECIRIYRAETPDSPEIRVRGELADAESAVPGWRISVDWIFNFPDAPGR
jgi:Uma2 family endonuclease